MVAPTDGAEKDPGEDVAASFQGALNSKREAPHGDDSLDEGVRERGAQHATAPHARRMMKLWNTDYSTGRDMPGAK